MHRNNTTELLTKYGHVIQRKRLSVYTAMKEIRSKKIHSNVRGISLGLAEIIITDCRILSKSTVNTSRVCKKADFNRLVA